VIVRWSFLLARFASARCRAIGPRPSTRRLGQHARNAGAGSTRRRADRSGSFGRHGRFGAFRAPSATTPVLLPRQADRPTRPARPGDDDERPFRYIIGQNLAGTAELRGAKGPARAREEVPT